MSGDSAPFGFPKRPGSPLPPDGLEAVVRVGRRRLRRSALWSAGAVLSVVGVVAGATLVGPGGNDALVLVPASPLPGVESSRSPAPAPVGGASPTPGPTATKGSREGTAPPFAEGGRDGEPVRATAPPGEVPRVDDRRTPYRESPSTITVYGGCLYNGVSDGSSPQDLCVQDYGGSQSVRSGAAIEVQIDVCTSLRRQGEASLEFVGGQEHDVTVRGEDGALWTWSRRHTFPEGEHSRRIPPGECMTWGTAWDTRDDAGRLVDPGTYTVVQSVEVNGTVRTIEMEVEVTG